MVGCAKPQADWARAPQVFYKRKPIPPAVGAVDRSLVPPDSLIYYIPGTEEVFVHERDYMARIHFLNQHQFTCEISGHRNLTFEQARLSEEKHLRELTSSFPEALKEPILRKVQFNFKGRLEFIVDWVYEEFKGDYFPGEWLIAKIGGQRYEVLVREKVAVGPMLQPDGSLGAARTRYRVEYSADSFGNLAECYVDAADLARERGGYSRSLIRSFLKMSMALRVNQNMPWAIKDELARKYRITTVPPPNVRHWFESHDRSGAAAVDRPPSSFARPPDYGAEPDAISPRPALPSLGLFDADVPHDPMVAEPPAQPLAIPEPEQAPPPPPPPPPKYPLDEDLDVPNGDTTAAAPVRIAPHQSPNFKRGHCGTLNLVWAFLNTYSKCLVLDYFTLDDLVESLYLKEKNVKNELLAEVHCALLNQFVGEDGELLDMLEDETEGEDEDEEEEEEEEQEDEEDDEREEEDGDDADDNADDDDNDADEGRAGFHAREAKGGKSLPLTGESAGDDTPVKSETPMSTHDQHDADESSERTKLHVADADDTGFGNGVKLSQILKWEQAAADWRDRLSAKLYHRGSWCVILLGIMIHQVRTHRSSSYKYVSIIEHLTRSRATVNERSIRTQYLILSAAQKLTGLALLTELAVTTPKVRHYVEECLAYQTYSRRERQNLHRNHRFETDRVAIIERRIRTEFSSGSPATAMSTDDKPEANGSNSDEALPREKTHKANIVPSRQLDIDEDASSAMNLDSDYDSDVKSMTLSGDGKPNLRKSARDKREEQELLWRSAKKRRMVKDSGADVSLSTQATENYSVKVDSLLPDAKAQAPTDTKGDIEDGNEDDMEPILDPVTLQDCQKELSRAQKAAQRLSAKLEQLEIEAYEKYPLRVPLLGEDRFHNRYYWFERSGMPMFGSTDSSIACGYANGRIWVQGSDSAYWLPKVAKTPIEDTAYALDRVLRQKARELDAFDEEADGPENWGYYETPEELNALLAWLNRNGSRENGLFSELSALQDRITQSMTARRSYLLKFGSSAESDDSDAEGHGEQSEGESNDDDEEGQEDTEESTTPARVTRSSTRAKNAQQKNVAIDFPASDGAVANDADKAAPNASGGSCKSCNKITALSADGDRFTAWQNLEAIRVLGHTLSDSGRKATRGR